MQRISREFIHGKSFDKQWKNLGLDDDNLRDLQKVLLENPKIGDVIQGTGRLRKMRFAFHGKGKSGGVRVCYVDFEQYGIVFLVMVFSKNEMENLSDAEKNSVKSVIERLENLLNQRSR